MDKSLSKSKLWDPSEDDVTERITLHICSKTRKYPYTCENKQMFDEDEVNVADINSIWDFFLTCCNEML